VKTEKSILKTNAYSEGSETLQIKYFQEQGGDCKISYFIVLLTGSTCFEYYYAHHQELATMMLITTLVISFLVCCMLEVRCRTIWPMW